MPPLLSGIASRRPLPSQAPTAAQTASVLEFRCLFTHDVRRKAKRWQDGYLSFHAFNNRVVVYDENRHRVGDTYINANDEGQHAVNEGDELSLQQGALVEVGERQSTREQDVSQVIVTRETPRKEQVTARVYPDVRRGTTQTSRFLEGGTSLQGATQHNGRQQNMPAAAVGTPAAAAPPPLVQGIRPKSLKEVLNTPSASIGRARISNRSPYEQRHAPLSGLQNIGQPIQVCRLAGPGMQPPQATRAAKRLRTDDGNAAHERLQRSPQKTPEPIRQRPMSTVSAMSPPEQIPPKKGQRAASPIMLDSDSEAVQQSPLIITPISSRIASPMPLQKPKQKERRKENKSTISTVAVEATKEDPRAKKRKKEKKKRTEKSKASPEQISEQRELQKTATIETQTRPRKQPRTEPLKERSVNMLRPSNGRRKKIMYRELLPEGFVPRNSKLQPRPGTGESINLETDVTSTRSSKEKSLEGRRHRKWRGVIEETDEMGSDFEETVLAAENVVEEDSVDLRERTSPTKQTPHRGKENSPPAVLDGRPPNHDATTHSILHEDEPSADKADEGPGVLSTMDLMADFSFEDDEFGNTGFDGANADKPELAPGPEPEPGAVPEAVPEAVREPTPEPAPEPEAEPEPEIESDAPPPPSPPPAPAPAAGYRRTPDSPVQVQTSAAAKSVNSDLPNAANPFRSEEVGPPAANQHRPPQTYSRPLGVGRMVGAPRTRGMRAQQPAFQPPRPVAKPTGPPSAAPAAPPSVPPENPKAPTAPTVPAANGFTTASNLASELASGAGSDSIQPQAPPSAAAPFRPPQHRSPLKRTFSAPPVESPRQKRTLTKSHSEMRPNDNGSTAAGAAAGGAPPVSAAMTFAAVGAAPDPRDADRGPWSREAFDLFGWRPGDGKDVRVG